MCVFPHLRSGDKGMRIEGCAFYKLRHCPLVGPADLLPDCGYLIVCLTMIVFSDNRFVHVCVHIYVIRVDQILGKGQIPMDKKIREKLLPDGESLEGMSMLGRVCKVERQVSPKTEKSTCICKIMLQSCSHSPFSLSLSLFSRSPPSSQSWTPCWTSTASSCTKVPRPYICPPCPSCSWTITSAAAPMSWVGTPPPLRRPTLSATAATGRVTPSVAIPGGACASSWRRPTTTTTLQTRSLLPTHHPRPRSPRHRCCPQRAPTHHTTCSRPEGPTSQTYRRHPLPQASPFSCRPFCIPLATGAPLKPSTMRWRVELRWMRVAPVHLWLWMPARNLTFQTRRGYTPGRGFGHDGPWAWRSTLCCCCPPAWTRCPRTGKLLWTNPSPSIIWASHRLTVPRPPAYRRPLITAAAAMGARLAMLTAHSATGTLPNFSSATANWSQQKSI